MDERPNDHNDPQALSRRMACDLCGHDEHVLRCGALISEAHNVVCPCRPMPVPGIYP